jgi:hypothetical protein
MNMKEKVGNVTPKVIFNIWRTGEQVRFNFSFAIGKTAR